MIFLLTMTLIKICHVLKVKKHGFRHTIHTMEADIMVVWGLLLQGYAYYLFFEKIKT